MDTWIFAWLLIAILSTLAVTAVLVALARHVLQVGRSVRELSEVAKPMAEEIGREGSRASERSANLHLPRSGGGSRAPRR